VRTANVPESKHGWVLLEAIVALTVLSVGVWAVNRALQDALLTRAMAQDYTQARFFLEQVISELELQPVLAEGASKSGTFGDDYPRFSYTWMVSKVDVPAPQIPPQLLAIMQTEPELPVPYLGKLRVTVNWTRAGRSFSRSLETLIAPNRLYTQEERDAALTR
jgi:hypothetical protein